MSTDKENAILQVTEDMVRQGGYNGFSFRNIATAVGIKSSSVHYHFATKEDLAVAVARNYTDKFLEGLGNPAVLHRQGKQPIVQYIKAFRSAIEEDKGMCLCGILAAETDALPDAVVNEAREFFRRNIDWLQRAFEVIGSPDNAHELAVNTLCVLEGAMITCNVMGDIALFDTATRSIVKS